MSDTFRKTYRELTESEKKTVDLVKDLAEQLKGIFDEANNPNIGREIALANTKLEECIMWAVKGLTK